MSNDLEQTLKALLEDLNIPEEVFERAFDFLVQYRFKNGLKEIYSSREFAHQCLAHFRLCGPRVVKSKKPLRVARFLSVNSFFRDYCSTNTSITYLSDKDKFNLIVSEPNRLISLIDPDDQQKRPCWVTSAMGLRQTTPPEMIMGLGLPSDWVPVHALLFEYEIDSSLLRVPTVLDACLQPFFVAKPHGTDDPRTWNWYTQSWGLAEYVHAPTREIRNPKVTPLMMGREVREQLPFRLHSDKLITAVRTPRDEHMEVLLAHILKQLAAHLELNDLISGKRDILTLTHREFEIFLGTLYSRKGFRAQVTRASRDDGIDVIAFSDETRKRGILIQAKHTSRTVGISIIRELVGARFFYSEEFSDYLLLVATTSKFSREARRVERLFPTHICLHDYGQLKQELERIGAEGISDIILNAKVQRQHIIGAGI